MIAVHRALPLAMVAAALAQTPTSAPQNGPSPFLSVPQPVSDSLRFGDVLPPFEAKDINGRTWRSEDLRGKFTLIYIWHTFDARTIDRIPARGESSGAFRAFPTFPRSNVSTIRRKARRTSRCSLSAGTMTTHTHRIT